MAKLFNRVKVVTTTTGTGTVTLGSAMSGYQTFANAGVANGDVVAYTIEDGTAWEVGTGTYTTVGTTLSRTLDESSTGALLNLSGAAIVFLTPRADDLPVESWIVGPASAVNGNIPIFNGTTGKLVIDSLTSINGAVNGVIRRENHAGTDADNTIPRAALSQGSGLSVIGRTANTTGNVADITAANDGEVLRRSGTTLGFGAVATAGISDNAVTYAKMQDVSATDRLLGRSSGGSGDVQEITCTAAGRAILDDADAAAQRATLAAYGVIRSQAFTATGTYTPHANMLYCIIECVGGGGGGGSASSGVTTAVYGGGGGGAGGYSLLAASAATIGASKAVTIGAGGAGGASGSNNGAAGGDTSLGVLCIGKGGSGGLYGSGAQFPTGGAGGVAGTGTVVAAGAPGGYGAYVGSAGVYVASGTGGSSRYGGGAAAVMGSVSGTAAGTAAGAYGGGGSGGSVNSVIANAAGGNGSAGFVIVTEFCSA